MPNKWWQPSPAKEIQAVPWLAPAVIAKLESILLPTSHVIEHGCGGSTLWLAKRVAYVMAVDNNADWREKINAKLDPLRGHVFSNLGEIHTTDFANKFDLLLIDGEPVIDRVVWINNVVNLVRPGGWVVLDNCNRPEYAVERKWLQDEAESFETFDGNEPGTKYLVTEFYKMKAMDSNENREQPKPKRKSRKVSADSVGGDSTPAKLRRVSRPKI